MSDNHSPAKCGLMDPAELARWCMDPVFVRIVQRQTAEHELEPATAEDVASEVCLELLTMIRGGEVIWNVFSAGRSLARRVVAEELGRIARAPRSNTL